MVTTHNSEAVISIVDEIIRSQEVTISPDGTQSFEAIIGEAGVILSILPTIGADGSTNLRIRPTISAVSDNNPNDFVTTLTKRDVLAQNVNLRDGETFVLAGLIQDTNTDSITKNPILSELPIVGALARSSTRNKNRTELIISITPHIMDDENGVARASRASQMEPTNLPGNGGTRNTLTPVSQGSVDIPGVLPPLQGVSVLDSIQHDGSGNFPVPQHYIEPVPAVTRDTSLMMLQEEEKEDGKHAQPESPPPSSANSPLSAEDASEQSIQAILDRFKAY